MRPFVSLRRINDHGLRPHGAYAELIFIFIIIFINALNICIINNTVNIYTYYFLYYTIYYDAAGLALRKKAISISAVAILI